MKKRTRGKIFLVKKFLLYMLQFQKFWISAISYNKKKRLIPWVDYHNFFSNFSCFIFNINNFKNAGIFFLHKPFVKKFLWKETIYYKIKKTIRIIEFKSVLWERCRHARILLSRSSEESIWDKVYPLRGN